MDSSSPPPGINNEWSLIIYLNSIKIVTFSSVVIVSISKYLTVCNVKYQIVFSIVLNSVLRKL